jgi:uncharacterized protein
MKLILISFLLSSCSLARGGRVVEVTGKCEIGVIPDRASISFTAENQSREQKIAVTKTNEQINQLKDKINSLNLPNLELKNTNYAVFPVREYEKERYVDKGTRATLTLEVSTSDIASLGETLTLASQLGIQNVGALIMSLSPEKAQTEYLKCLDIASQDAQQKAQRLAKNLGFKVGEVKKVIESPLERTSAPEPKYMLKSLSAESMTSTKLEAGEQQFSTTLQVSFKIN